MTRAYIALAAGSLMVAGCALGLRCEAGPARWSEAVNGLRIRLATDRAEVPMGANAVFRLHFRFDPAGVDPKLNILNRFLEERRVKLTFTDVTTGKAFERQPDDGWRDMPPSPRPRDFVELRGKAVEPRRLVVHLLTEAGEQLPPGTYSVALTYGNDGKPELEFSDRPDGTLVQRPYSGPWKLWAGKLAAPAIALTVTPAAAGEIKAKMNSALVLWATGVGIEWSWSPKDPLILSLRPRPGHVLGREHKLRMLLDGRDAGGCRRGMMNRTWHSGEGRGFLYTPIKNVLAGQTLTLRAEVEVFETSVQSGHMWQPRGGDYKVLWSGKIEGTLPASEVAKWGKDPVGGLQCTLSSPKAEYAAGEAVPVTLEVKNVGKGPLPVWAYDSREDAVVTRAPDGKVLEQAIWNDLPISFKKALVLKPGEAKRVSGDMRPLFAGLGLAAPHTFRLIWYGRFIVGREDEASTGLHVSNSVAVTIRPGKPPNQQGRQ